MAFSIQSSGHDIIWYRRDHFVDLLVENFQIDDSTFQYGGQA